MRASNVESPKFWLDNKHIYAHLLDASINTVKYLDDPLGGLIDPHISQWIHFKNVGDSIPTLVIDGLIINSCIENKHHMIIY